MDVAAIYGGGVAWGACQPSRHGVEVDSLCGQSSRRRRPEVGEGPDKRAQGGIGTERGAGQSEGERGKRRDGVAAGPKGQMDWLRREQRQAEGERGKGAGSREREGRNSRAGRQRGEEQAFRLN